jgi:CRISPR/Cas system CSM-associated protein Csm3 (group 7 of RAMP superfamily)
VNYRIIERIHARGMWVAQTALHIGGEAEEFGATADLVVARDRSGPYVPAASLAGVSRNWLRKRLGSSDDHEHAAIHIMFGDDYASLLAFCDAGIQRHGGTLVRDGVRIDPDSGTAVDEAKYDLEVLPAGTQFLIELSMILYDTPPDYLPNRQKLKPGDACDPQVVSNKQLRWCLREILAGFTRGDIRIGAKTRRGFGKGKVQDWDVRRLDLGNRRHFAAWLRQDPWPVQTATLDDPDGLDPLHVVPCKTFTIDATLRIATSLLIRSCGEDAGGPEFVHLSERGRALLTGTSLAGAFRHRAEKIARTIAESQKGPEEKVKELVNGLFGYVDERNKKAQASRVSISEDNLPGGRQNLHVQGRVTIDRFTGGALDGALFDEAAYWPSEQAAEVGVFISIDQPSDAEMALLLLTFKDLWLGDLPVGGESSVGRGILRGRGATISRSGAEILRMEAPSHDAEAAVFPLGDAASLNQLVDKLWRELAHV